MFSQLVISDPEIDAGAIAEALVYFGKVTVATYSSGLLRFVETLGLENLLRCIESGHLEFTYAPSQIALAGGEESSLFGLNIIALVPTKDRGKPVEKQVSLHDDVEEHFRRAFGNGADTRRRAHSLSEKLTEFTQQTTILEGVKRDFFDVEYMDAAIRIMLAERAPQYAIPVDLRLKLREFEGRILFRSDVDYAAAGIKRSAILIEILRVRQQLFHAASRQSELWISPKQSALVGARINILAQRLSRNREAIDLFHSVQFQGRSFREAINNGDKTFRELLDLIETEDARKFRAWLNDLPADSKLITEYDRSIFAGSPTMQRLPFKAMRMVAFAGLGTAIGLAADGRGAEGAAVGAIVEGAVEAGLDQITERLMRGWKPNQFVDGSASAFLGPGLK